MRIVDLVKAARKGDLDTVKKILSENFEFKHNELDIALSHSLKGYYYSKSDTNFRIYRKIMIELLKSGACLSKYASNEDFVWFYDSDAFRNTNGGLDILLWYFIKDGDLELVELLIDCGANIYSYDANYQLTPLSIASKNGHIAIVEFLIDFGINVNYNINGKTALMYSSQNGHLDIVKLLITSGADVNLKDNDSKTALMYASKNGHLDIVKLLIDSRARINLKNNDSKTALSIAIDKGYDDIVKLLKSRGAY